MLAKADREAAVIDALYRGACDRSELETGSRAPPRLLDGAAAVLGEGGARTPGGVRSHRGGRCGRGATFSGTTRHSLPSIQCPRL